SGWLWRASSASVRARTARSIQYRARVPLQVVGQRSECSQRLAKLLQRLDELVAERRVLIQSPVNAGQGDLRALQRRPGRIRRLLPRHEQRFDLCVDLCDDTMEVLQDRKSTRLNSSHVSISYA